MFHNNLNGILALCIVILLSYGFILLWGKKLSSFRFDLGINNSINTNLRFVLIITLVILLFYLDFVRDYVFKNLDWRMGFQYQMENGGSPDKYVDATDSWMKALLGDTSSNTIYKLKYLASAIFILIYAFVSHVILRLVYPANNALPYILLIYGLGTLTMGLVFSFYFFTWPHDTKLKFYLTAMEIGHFLESSLPTLLSILGFKIYLTTQEAKPNE